MNHNRYIRSIVCIVLIVLYIAGLLCMFFSAPSQGIALWVLSTVGGLFALYYIRSKEEKDAAQDAQHSGDGDDQPCE